MGENPPLTEQAIVKALRPIDMTLLSKLLTVGFRCAVLQGVDPNVNNMVGSGVVTLSNAGSCPILMRIETNAQAQMYRVTIKSPSALVTAAMKDLITMQLG